MNKAVFLDRDGVVNIDRGYVYKVDDFTFCQGTFDAIRKLKELGYLVVVITNQSGIGRGYFSESEFHTLSIWMRNELRLQNADIDALYFCPHLPEQNCECRKPRNALFKKAIYDFKIEVGRSWMLGDKTSDIDAATSVGVAQTIMVNSVSKCERAKFCVDNISGAVELIKNN